MKMNVWKYSVQHLKYPAREWVNNGNKDVKIRVSGVWKDDQDHGPLC